MEQVFIGRIQLKLFDIEGILVGRITFSINTYYPKYQIIHTLFKNF